jgi:diguanylate cyclase (GGDEF)-like protein/PAS domain S-box-containing protein
MNLFKPKTFKGKLSVLIVMTTGLALLIAIIAFTLNDNISVKKNLQSRLETQAKIISDTSVTALLFDDQKASEEILSSLEADPSITQAAIYDTDGNRYATYTNGTEITLAEALVSAELSTDNSFEKLEFPIQYNGEKIGQLVIVASKAELTQRVIYFGTTAVFILLIALLLSFAITRRLQDEILLPISSLTQLASKVRDEKNYDLRVKVAAKDELGILGAMFNEMLSKVQERDNNLETLVSERTQQLEEKNDELSVEITERKTMLTRLEKSEESFKSSFDQSAISMALIADDQVILQVNNAFCLMLGYHEEELVGKSLMTIIDDPEAAINARHHKQLVGGAIQHYQVEQRYIKKTGSIIWGLLNVSAVRHSNTFDHAMVQIQDVTEARELSNKLTYQASHDSLTGLINRREFEIQIRRLVANNENNQHAEHALVYIDLDQFKIINDTCGHVAGDELLRQISTLMDTMVRQADTLARLGGDEFGILMRYCNLEQSQRLAESLRKEIEEFRFVWDGQVFNLAVSLGIASINHATNNITEIMRRADTACYMAKEFGRNRIHVFHDEDEKLAERQGEMQWVARINTALEEDKFHLYAQAIMNIGQKKITHYEVLIRLEDEQGNIIPPGAFLPAAERYNLISKLDRWVIQKSIAWLTEQSAQSNDDFIVSINISGLSFGESGFTEYVLDLLSSHKIRNERICFEITETAAIANLSSVTDFIKQLQQQGCLFALDDFGSGMSSFAYLKNLPVDFLKIDGMFVKDNLDDPIYFEMVKSINEIGHVMGKKTIAEFVENDAILAKLEEIGVDYAQGYGIGLPQPIEHVLEAEIVTAS